MQKIRGSVCIYGVGVMGQAIGKALLERGLVNKSSLWGVSKTEVTAKQVRKKLGIAVRTKDFERQIKSCSIIILGVKPSQCRAALKELRAQGLSSKTLILSIVTGVSLAALQEGVGPKVSVMRAVTNTPCLVGQGMTALCSAASVTSQHRKTARTIFEGVGKCIEIDEQHCEAMTGLSACGPAYIYLIIEALADGGVKVGLPRDTALSVVVQTMLGATMMVQQSGRHPASLRDDVTTPAGCTIGGVLILEDGRLRSTLARAVEEATRIAKELGKS